MSDKYVKLVEELNSINENKDQLISDIKEKGVESLFKIVKKGASIKDVETEEVAIEALDDEVLDFLHQIVSHSRYEPGKHSSFNKNKQRFFFKNAHDDMMKRKEDALNKKKDLPPELSDEQVKEIEARIKELESKFDPTYEYSDDHSVWAPQNRIHSELKGLRQRLFKNKQAK